MEGIYLGRALNDLFVEADGNEILTSDDQIGLEYPEASPQLQSTGLLYASRYVKISPEWAPTP